MKNSLFISILLFCSAIFAQDGGTIQGRISDAEMHGEPLLFADVRLKGTDHNTRTNFHGNFEFPEVMPGDYTVVVEFLGYEGVEIPVHIKDNEVVFVSHSLEAKTISLADLHPAGNMREIEETQAAQAGDARMDAMP